MKVSGGQLRGVHCMCSCSVAAREDGRTGSKRISVNPLFLPVTDRHSTLLHIVTATRFLGLGQGVERAWPPRLGRCSATPLGQDPKRAPAAASGAATPRRLRRG